MARITLTYGVLPSLEDFDRAWQASDVEEHFIFGNDSRLGSCSLTQWELWDELKKAAKEFNEGDTMSADDAGDWVSCVLSVLGIEWI